MFSRITAATIALAVALPMVVASPTAVAARGAACNTGSLECCRDVTDGGSAAASAIGGLLGISALLTKVVGISCTPINVIGVGGNHCTQQTVCCENNSFNGVIALGCTPVNVGL